MRTDFDADRQSGGYRDVQLSVRLLTPETKERELEAHIAEVQLHLADFLRLKSNGGHFLYTLCRNMAAE